MSLYTPSSPHFHMDNSVSQIMLRVVYALIPGILLYVLFFGFGVVINLLIAIITALSCEAVILIIRKRPVLPFLSDGSALVTAVLLALSVPSIAPWWIIFVGTAFAIVIAKHLYGGLGYNPFNPAMAAYAMLLVSYPLQMTTWQLPLANSNEYLGLIDSFLISFYSPTSAGLSIDAISGATPLDYLKSQLGLERTVSQVVQSNANFGLFGGSGFEWVNIAFLVGGIWLMKKKVISWHIPVSTIGSLFILSLIFYIYNSELYASPIFHLFTGATILCAFFIATDPVSAATTPRGKIWFGVGIGILIFIIRNWGGFPDAVAFAVLLMNMCAPTIDYYTKPKPYGH